MASPSSSDGKARRRNSRPQRQHPRTRESEAWLAVARAYGIEPSYRDMNGRLQTAHGETLKGILENMGVPASSRRHLAEARRLTRLRRWRRPCEPVAVAWDGAPVAVTLRLADPTMNGLRVRLFLEDGREKALDSASAFSPRLTKTQVEGESFCTRNLKLPALPCGYHRLELHIGEQIHDCLIIAAPRRSYSPPGAPAHWGIFLPLYALHSQRSWGAGNLTDWRALTQWAGALGANVIATLPLLASFLDQPVCDPSPYAPVSRLFWNEFYLDLGRGPGFYSPATQKLVCSSRVRKALAEFRTEGRIAYRAQMDLRREVLERMARSFFHRPSPTRKDFQIFLKRNPRVEDYAEFRATCDATGKPWHLWDPRKRHGKLQAGDFSQDTKRYYLFSQWLINKQISEFSEFCRRQNILFHLDLPLGVHPDGYDTWRQRELFAFPAAVGAPPDLFFSQGQNWGFAPLHPERLRETQYRYVRDYLEFQMRFCQILRIDHVMGLHRLYWIPSGCSPRQGAYVQYPAEELYAVLSLESHRHQSMIVGENLGTVPPAVNRSMARHQIRETYVLQYAQSSDPKRPVHPPPRCSVATLNTHDMAPFAAHWHARDLRERARLCRLSKSTLKRELDLRRTRNAALVSFLKRRKCFTNSEPGVGAILNACLRWLAASSTETLLVNLEDLWLEQRRQNTPGTTGPRNWRRKARLSLEEICQSRALRKILRELNRLRRTR